ncbi:MAG: replicative DNA helicase [Candidatus Parvarchaeum sp.]
MNPKDKVIPNFDPSATLPRTIPCNVEAEETLLGAMLLSPLAIAHAQEWLVPTDFWVPLHRHIFSAILEVDSRGEPVDAILVQEELSRHQVNCEPAKLLSLVAMGTPPSMAEHYAKIIHHHSLLRRLTQVGEEIVDLGYTPTADLAAVLDKAQSLVFALNDKKRNETVREAQSILENTYLELTDTTLIKREGVPSGYTALDQHLGGFKPSNLIVVGARPSMGKTAFALKLAAHTACHDVPTLLFSLEMNHEEVAERLLSIGSRINLANLRSRPLSRDEINRLGKAYKSLENAQLYVDDTPNLTIMDIRAKARRISAQKNIGLIVVDYLQLMTAYKTKNDSRQSEIAEISRGLKILAREIDIPIIALSQLSRALESRLDKRPMLSDLRESGAIEQDADIVLFLYRDEVYRHDSEDQGMAEVIISKNRNGPIGSVRLAFQKECARFGNMDGS